MNLTERFAASLRFHREAAGLSQDRLADKSGLDRTFISQLERGLKSPTLTTLERIAKCLVVAVPQLLVDVPQTNRVSLLIERDYLVRDLPDVVIVRGGKRIRVSASLLVSAIDVAHQLIDQIYSIDLNIAAILGLRNLSAFVGELFAASVVRIADGLFQANPHQDGYPDLLLMDVAGQKAWSDLSGHHNEKAPFSPFPGGGIEVKATCGSVPTPKVCSRRKIRKPDLGDARIHCLQGYDWKAHHRETGNLAGLLWDFVDERPRIVGLFYCASLSNEDWGRIVQPKEGGGRTTSVSIMSQSGIRKMYEGWLCVKRDGGYIRFLNERNHGKLIPDD